MKTARTIPIKKLITRNGKQIVTTVYVNPEEHEKHKEKSSKTTKELNTDSKGNYLPERVNLHKGIVKRILLKCKKPKEGEKPLAILLLGGAASGKSTVVRDYITPKYGDMGTLNNDDIKAELPEFNDKAYGKNFRHSNVETAAARVHNEGSDITKVAFNLITNDKRNFIYDGTLANEEKSKRMVNELKKKGYNVKLVGVSLETDEALRRAEIRAYGNDKIGVEATGRFVPEEILKGDHAGAVKTFENIKSSVDEVELYDNNVPFGATPILALSGSKNKMKVHKPDLYDRFLNKMKKSFGVFTNLIDKARSLFSIETVYDDGENSLSDFDIMMVKANENLHLVKSFYSDISDIYESIETANSQLVDDTNFILGSVVEKGNTVHIQALSKRITDTHNSLIERYQDRLAELNKSLSFAEEELKLCLLDLANDMGYDISKSLMIAGLRKEKVIDKNGNVTTRWKKPEKVTNFNGTLGIPRSEMPQIKSDKVDDFVNWLNKKGVACESGEMEVSKIKPTQAEMNVDKVALLMNGENLDHLKKRVILSKENRLFDGHHRWAALLFSDKENKIVYEKVDLPIRKLLELAKEYKHTNYKEATDVGGSLNKGEDENPFKAFDYDSIEKGKTAQVGEIREWQGQKMQKTPNGWVPVTNGKQTKKDDPEKQKTYTDDELAGHAKQSSEQDLQNTIKTAKDPKLREAAHQELDRRQKQEHVPDDKSTETNNKAGDKKKSASSKNINDSYKNPRKKQWYDFHNKKHQLSRLPVGIEEKDVEVNDGTQTGNWVLRWVDPKTGKKVTAYSKAFLKKNAQNKWKRIQNISSEDIQKIKTKADSLLKSRDKEVSEAGAIVSIIANTGLRPGSKSGFNETENRGVSTLAKENVKIKGDSIEFEFTGKSYKNNTAKIKNKELADYLKAKIADKQDSDFVFDTDISKVRNVFQSKFKKGLKLKDMRTYVATDMARDILFNDKQAPPPLPEKGTKKAIQDKLKNVFVKVSDQLNNSPTMAKTSYIHPNVINAWLKTLNVSEAQMFMMKSDDDYEEMGDNDDYEDTDQYPYPEWWDESLDDEEMPESESEEGEEEKAPESLDEILNQVN